MVEAQFAKDIEHHEITEVSAAIDAVRLWHCAKPNTSNCWFRVLAWPNTVMIDGDHGTYVFKTGTADTLGLFRTCELSYIRGKCVAFSGPLKKFSVEKFQEILSEVASEARAEKDDETPQKIAEIREAFRQYESEHDAMKAMYESGVWDCDLPDCTEYDFHFEWCLLAIKWFLAKEFP